MTLARSLFFSFLFTAALLFTTASLSAAKIPAVLFACAAFISGLLALFVTTTFTEGD